MHHLDFVLSHEPSQPPGPPRIGLPASLEADGGHAELRQPWHQVVLPGQEIRRPELKTRTIGHCCERHQQTLSAAGTEPFYEPEDTDRLPAPSRHIGHDAS